MNAGATEYLDKPTHSDDFRPLLTIVRSCLHSRANRRNTVSSGPV